MKLLVDRSIWEEVFAAARWYDRERAGLGDEFVMALDEDLEKIRSNPDTWPRWPGIKQDTVPIQRYVMRRFPDAIGYQVLADAVVIVAVAHAKRRPGYWR